MGILHLKKNDFAATIASGTALIDFWAGWCMPCKMLVPVIEDISEEYGDSITVGKVDIDAEGDIATEFGIMSIPTVILFKDGKEVQRFVGVQPKEVYAGAIGPSDTSGSVADLEDVNMGEVE